MTQKITANTLLQKIQRTVFMNIDPQEVRSFQVRFDAGNLVPPPYHYAYTLEVDLADKNTPANYAIRYLHREELSEEEILDEGFTPNDDWSWKGTLPQNWRNALLEQIKKQSWPTKPEKPGEGEAALEIRLLGEDEKALFDGKPADIASWEYFLQELIQAMYEISGKEAPFELIYREIKRDETYEIQLKASFAERSMQAKELHNGQEANNIQPDWKLLKNLMKTIYVPDYDYENAREQEPKKRGKYIFTGEGLWFKFGDSLIEPDKKSKSLDRLEDSLKGLFGERD